MFVENIAAYIRARNISPPARTGVLGAVVLPAHATPRRESMQRAQAGRTTSRRARVQLHSPLSLSPNATRCTQAVAVRRAEMQVN